MMPMTIDGAFLWECVLSYFSENCFDKSFTFFIYTMAILVVVSILFINSYISCENKFDHDKTNTIDKQFSKLDFNYESKSICHKAAVWSCGHSLIKLNKYLEYLSPRDAFYPKCAIKNAFFNCLKKNRIKPCISKKRYHTEKFRRKLAETLWSTKSCIVVPLFSVVNEA